MRFLYSLGVDKESIIENGNEIWLFEKSNSFNYSLTNGSLSLNPQLIIPYQKMNLSDYSHLVKH